MPEAAYFAKQGTRGRHCFALVPLADRVVCIAGFEVAAGGRTLNPAHRYIVEPIGRQGLFGRCVESEQLLR